MHTAIYGEEKLFYPDFIFWLQKEQQQTILFIDPKGNRHTDYEHKVDGYINIFENKVFKKLNTIINVKLSLIKMTNDSVGKAYEKYWCSVDSLKKIFI